MRINIVQFATFQILCVISFQNFTLVVFNISSWSLCILTLHIWRLSTLKYEIKSHLNNGLEKHQLELYVQGNEDNGMLQVLSFFNKTAVNQDMQLTRPKVFPLFLPI